MLLEAGERDLMKYTNRTTESTPIQVPEVTPGVPQNWGRQPDPPCNPRSPGTMEWEPQESMVISDVETGQVTIFDAFVSACEEDFDYVKELKQVLEDKHKLKLYIDGRDLLPGADIHTVTADIIAKRCRKILLLMTPEYLKSRQYEFQSKIALSLSPGGSQKFIIPVLLKQLDEIPLVMRHIQPVDNTREDMCQWFWSRLLAAIKNQHFIPLKQEQLKLRDLHIPLRKPGSIRIKGNQTTATCRTCHAQSKTQLKCEPSKLTPNETRVKLGSGVMSSEMLVKSDLTKTGAEAIPSETLVKGYNLVEEVTHISGGLNPSQDETMLLKFISPLNPTAAQGQDLLNPTAAQGQDLSEPRTDHFTHCPDDETELKAIGASKLLPEPEIVPTTSGPVPSEHQILSGLPDHDSEPLLSLEQCNTNDFTLHYRKHP